MSQAAPPSSAKGTEEFCGKQDSEEYKKLSGLLNDEKYKNSHLKELEASAKCPFKVLNYKGFIRVMCDFSECARNNSCDQDCRQVYVKAADIIPRRGCKKKKKVTTAVVEMGCIYEPKQSKHSIETVVPVAAE